jgi:hypothetical protein
MYFSIHYSWTCVQRLPCTQGVDAVYLCLGLLGHPCCNNLGLLGHTCCNNLGLLGHTCCNHLGLLSSLQEGQEDGLGVFTFRDGSTYEGLWQQGRKHGVGVFRPPAGPDAVAASAAAAAAAQRRATSSQQQLPSVPSGSTPLPSSEAPAESHAPSLAHTSEAAVAPVLPPQGLAPSEAGGALPVPELQQKPPPAPLQAVLIKEYNQGELLCSAVRGHEQVLECAALAASALASGHITGCNNKGMLPPVNWRWVKGER